MSFETLGLEKDLSTPIFSSRDSSMAPRMALPLSLLEHLQEQNPDQDWISLKRTLQRRVKDWKALHGPAPAVMFPLAYQPCEIGFCDFTRLKRVAITLRGEPFPHLLFHYRLAHAGMAGSVPSRRGGDGMDVAPGRSAIGASSFRLWRKSRPTPPHPSAPRGG